VLRYFEFGCLTSIPFVVVCVLFIIETLFRVFVRRFSDVIKRGILLGYYYYFNVLSFSIACCSVAK
ncbi:hypothetical protein AAHB49_28585, partial [Bacillus cereus]